MILQEFLACGLIAIGEDDKRLEWLDNAASELATTFLKNKRKLVNATLVALDRTLPDDEPVFEEVEAVVLDHWKALRGKYPDRPRQILRAVILAAFHKAQSDPTSAAIVWLVGGSFLPYAQLGNERSIIEKLFVVLGNIAEGVAVGTWTMTPSSVEQKLPEWTLKAPVLKQAANYKDWLQKRLGPATGAGAEVEDFPVNPHRLTPNQVNPNSQLNWSQHFAEYSAAAIATLISSTGTDIKNELGTFCKQLEKSLKEHADAVVTAVHQSIRQNAARQSASERRTALMWWRQALYSPSKRRGYRGLTGGVLAVLMAFDLHKEVMPRSPQSVEFLLREAVREAGGNATASSGERFLTEVLEAGSTMDLAALLGAPSDEESRRVCLVAVVREVLAGWGEPAQFSARVGVQPEQILPAEEWAVWIFRDLQALRLAAEK